MPTSREGYKYVLIIVDQLTRICICVPTVDCTASTAARIFVDRWLGLFPDPAFLVSDGGTHFKCTLFERIAEMRGFKHHIVAPHSQWANGGVERLNKVFLDAARALLHNHGVDICDWPKFTAAINGTLNKYMRISSRGNKTPIELLTALVAADGVEQIVWMGYDAVEAKGIPTKDIMDAFATAHEKLTMLWGSAVESQQKRREYNRRAGATLPRIQVGDMVMMAEAVRPNKLTMTWTGPHEVLSAPSKFVYELRPKTVTPTQRRAKMVHVVRIRPFANAPLGDSISIKRLEQAAQRDYPDNIVKRFVRHRVGKDGEFELRVRWLGFGEAHDTWEPVSNLVKDVPDMVERYLRKNQSKQACARLLRHYYST